MFTEEEQLGLDIDWFFTNNKHIAFAASAGGMLPESISKAFENYKILSAYFRSLPEISEISINKDLSKIIGSEADERYLEDFVFMAKKGLFSFDKSIPNNFDHSLYHLVAKPLTPLTFDQVPNEIGNILLKSRYVGSIDAFLDSALIK
jgi:hypothetical protein